MKRHGIVMVPFGSTLEEVLAPLAMDAPTGACFEYPCYCGTLRDEQESTQAFSAAAGRILDSLTERNAKRMWKKLEGLYAKRCALLAARFETTPAPLVDCELCQGKGSILKLGGHFDYYLTDVGWHELLGPIPAHDEWALPMDYRIAFENRLGTSMNPAVKYAIGPAPFWFRCWSWLRFWLSIVRDFIIPLEWRYGPHLPTPTNAANILQLEKTAKKAPLVSCMVSVGSTWSQRMEYESKRQWWERCRDRLQEDPAADVYPLRFHS